VPHVRDADSGWTGHATFWGHAGLYAYRRGFLRDFAGLPGGALEGAERLEQLRWLEAGVRLHSFPVAPQAPSVDTLDDLERVREMLDGVPT
jgi:3-deoxy-manno-octulosonate cytidylyltransferase (CMP-KDO synthetase)